MPHNHEYNPMWSKLLHSTDQKVLTLNHKSKMFQFELLSSSLLENWFEYFDRSIIVQTLVFFSLESDKYLCLSFRASHFILTLLPSPTRLFLQWVPVNTRECLFYFAPETRIRFTRILNPAIAPELQSWMWKYRLYSLKYYHHTGLL